MVGAGESGNNQQQIVRPSQQQQQPQQPTVPTGSNNEQNYNVYIL